jgi:hypothetical protein
MCYVATAIHSAEMRRKFGEVDSKKSS